MNENRIMTKQKNVKIREENKNKAKMEEDKLIKPVRR